MGIFGKLFGSLKKTKENFSGKLRQLFSKNKLGDEFYEELEEILISSDISVTTAEEVVARVKEQAIEERLKDEAYVTNLLRGVLTEILEESEVEELSYPCVIMLVGVNGVGKTTTVGKLAHYFLQKGKTVTVAAADTFRAAASEQLSVWAERAKVRIVKHEEGSDPSAVIFDAVASAKARNTDVVIVDTAGRLHVKDNLMNQNAVHKAQMRAFVKCVAINTGLGFNLWLDDSDIEDSGDDLSKHDLRAIQERMQQKYTELIKKGLTTREIAEKLRTNESTINYMLTKSFDDLVHFEKDLSAL